MITTSPHRLICFIGIDGSGKSTLAHRLHATLHGKGVKGRCIWGKFESLWLKLLIALKNQALVRGVGHAQQYAHGSHLKQRLFRDHVIGRCYELFVFVSYSLQLLHKVVLPLKRGEVVICDRYVYDSVVDLSLDRAYSPQQLAHTLAFYSRMYPRPDVVFWVDVPEEISLQRKTDIPSRSFLQDKRSQYRRIAKLMHPDALIWLDGTRSLPELQAEIRRTLQQGHQGGNVR